MRHSRVPYIALILCFLVTWRYTLLDPVSLLLEGLGAALPAVSLHRLYGLFEGFLSVSTQGVLLALLAAAVCFLLRSARCSKTVCLLLWAAAALRLLIPVSLPSHLSLFNLDYFSGVRASATRELDYEFTGDYQYTVPDWKNADAALEAGAEIVPVAPVGNAKNPLEIIYYYEDADGAITAAVSREDGYGGALALVWVGGALLLAGYGVVSYLLFKRRLRFAVKDENLPGVWYSDRISSPCVAGFFRPRIYLTFGLSETEKAHILAHERQHIKNGDHIWKLLAWLMVCVHWLTIHPVLLLLLYGVFLRCLEEACDQRVLSRLGEEHRAEYGTSLLALSTGQRFRPGPSPIAFGEGDTKHRIRTILQYKKPLLWVTVIAAVLAVVIGVCLFTDPAESDTPQAEGTYEISALLRQAPFSSITNETVVEQSRDAVIRLSQSRFEIEGAGYIKGISVEDPVYESMGKLGDTLVTWDTEDETLWDVFSVPIPAGTRGYRVLRSNSTPTGWHVFVLEDGTLWLGRWYGDGGGYYGYLFEAVPCDPSAPDVQDPTETDSPETTPPEEETFENDWEDLVLTWYIPLDADDPTEYGFPLGFSFPSDTFDASCAGGTPYAYREGVLLSGHPIQGASNSYLWWWPYETGSSKPAENASITATVYTDGEAVLHCSLLLNLVDVTDEDLVYSVRATLHGSEGYVYTQSTQNFGASIQQSPLDMAVLGEFSVDLTHDGVDETITIVGTFARETLWESYEVLVRDSKGRGLWSDSAGIPHAGQNGIYLYEEDGKHYLMNWNNYGISGYGSIFYTVFSLTERGEKVIRYKDDFTMEYDSPLSIDLEEYEVVNAESIRLLSNCIILASTNGDAPEESEQVLHSSPEHIITPVLQEDYLMWWTPEELAAIQKKAKGTYTFQGEVVGVFDDRLLVEDQSLWAPDYLYYFSVPAQDPAAFTEGDKVSVTADGPLYRNYPPDEGTHVTVEKLS